MAQIKESPAGDGGAFGCLAGRRDTLEHTQNRRAMQRAAPPPASAISERRRKPDEIAAELKLERMVQRVHSLGPRPLGELLAEIATVTGQPDLIADRVEAYSRLDPAVLRAIGGDRFPPMPLEVVR